MKAEFAISSDELQRAIDKTYEMIKVGNSDESLRKSIIKHLNRLLKVQSYRAGVTIIPDK